ncbi:MAG: L-threonylcarbamoyladenylate synthase [Candidatus Izemoplasmatales bacterium]|jgi:L-threonylcarbamoyladenylate synthase|nr:L-threonylcarbamoyladenylate synthase [Candidatus Izemoplasmatales bacterium]
MINTKVYTPKDLDKSSVKDDIRNTLLSGKNVIFPTETVYGIGAYALSETGVKSIYAVKGRPSDNPLIIHFTNLKDILDYVEIDQGYVKDLMQAFWPGPLTLVLRKKPIVPEFITGGLDTVGVRIPGHEIARKVIDIAGVPICAPSANISGKPSATLFEHVLEDFNGKVDIIIDGGKSEVGLESTVVDVTKEIPVILRPGMITKAMIKGFTKEVIMNSEVIGEETPKAPGMKYKHYAPVGELIIVEGEEKKVIDYINKRTKEFEIKGLKVGVISTNKIADQFMAQFVYQVGEELEEEVIASNLFAALRKMDNMKIDIIYSLSFSKGNFEEAIMNRLLKAANNNIIKL